MTCIVGVMVLSLGCCPTVAYTHHGPWPSSASEKHLLCPVYTDAHILYRRPVAPHGNCRTPLLMFPTVCSGLTTCYDDVAPCAFLIYFRNIRAGCRRSLVESSGDASCRHHGLASFSTSDSSWTCSCLRLARSFVYSGTPCLTIFRSLCSHHGVVSCFLDLLSRRP